MIHYHGYPGASARVTAEIWAARHAMVSFAEPRGLPFGAEICQSFALDNGAFSAWRSGEALDVPGFVRWVQEWERHPGFDFALIPDVIDGDEAQNDRMIEEYHELKGDSRGSVPVWHLHESLGRLVRLAATYATVALGSSGKFAVIGTPEWWARMDDAFEAICDPEGRPPCGIHGLRMLDPRVFTRFPLKSADSTNAGRNVSLDTRWRGPYEPASKWQRAAVLVDRIEAYNSAPVWRRNTFQDSLLGLEVGHA